MRTMRQLLACLIAVGAPAFLPMMLSAQKPVIPESMRKEHAELYAALAGATNASGGVGAAAQAVLRVLQPHFAREEQIALPPLGLLVALSRGTITPQMSAVLPLTDSLKAELPQMLEEHKVIAAAVQRFGDLARAEGLIDYVELAEKIKLHALTEEQVTYPAAIVVGDYVRMRIRVAARQ
jgi:hypothetical protein